MSIPNTKIQGLEVASIFSSQCRRGRPARQRRESRITEPSQRRSSVFPAAICHNPRSKVTKVSPATRAKAARYASGHCCDKERPPEVSLRKASSICSGSASISLDTRRAAAVQSFAGGPVLAFIEGFRRIGGKAGDLRGGLSLAVGAIESGAAMRTLDALRGGKKK